MLVRLRGKMLLVRKWLVGDGHTAGTEYVGVGAPNEHQSTSAPARLRNLPPPPWLPIQTALLTTACLSTNVSRFQYIYVIVYAVNTAPARTVSRPLQRPGSLPMVSLAVIITSLVAVLVPAAVTHSLPRHQHPRHPEGRVGPLLSVDCSLHQRRGPRLAPCPPTRILSRRSSAQCPL